MVPFGVKTREVVQSARAAKGKAETAAKKRTLNNRLFTIAPLVVRPGRRGGQDAVARWRFSRLSGGFWRQ